MQLLYRGIPYASNHSSIQNPATPKGLPCPKVRLIYRGNIYDYQPQPQVVDENAQSDGFWVTLTYRGQTYQRKLPTPPVYQQPRALNWRWQKGSGLDAMPN